MNAVNAVNPGPHACGTRRLRARAGGFAAIAALFILVVLASLGALMLNFSSGQQLASAQDIQGTRALWAARAGIEWALASLSGSPAACPVAPVPFEVEGFDVTIGCSRSTFDEAGQTRVIYTVSARAANSAPVGSLGRVERSVSASVEY